MSPRLGSPNITRVRRRSRSAKNKIRKKKKKEREKKKVSQHLQTTSHQDRLPFKRGRAPLTYRGEIFEKKPLKSHRPPSASTSFLLFFFKIFFSFFWETSDLLTGRREAALCALTAPVSPSHPPLNQAANQPSSLPAPLLSTLLWDFFFFFSLFACLLFLCFSLFLHKATERTERKP